MASSSATRLVDPWEARGADQQCDAGAARNLERGEVPARTRSAGTSRSSDTIRTSSSTRSRVSRRRRQDCQRAAADQRRRWRRSHTATSRYWPGGGAVRFGSSMRSRRRFRRVRWRRCQYRRARDTAATAKCQPSAWSVASAARTAFSERASTRLRFARRSLRRVSSTRAIVTSASAPASAGAPVPRAMTASAPVAIAVVELAAARRSRRCCWRRGKLDRTMGAEAGTHGGRPVALRCRPAIRLPRLNG